MLRLKMARGVVQLSCLICRFNDRKGKILGVVKWLGKQGQTKNCLTTLTFVDEDFVLVDKSRICSFCISCAHILPIFDTLAFSSMNEFLQEWLDELIQKGVEILVIISTVTDFLSTVSSFFPRKALSVILKSFPFWHGNFNYEYLLSKFLLKILPIGCVNAPKPSVNSWFNLEKDDTR